MQKLFRFKYEPCNGTCYAWCDTLPTELNNLPDEERRLIIKMMVDAHDRLCDNPDYSFGIDLDKENGIFIAHFREPNNLTLFANKQFNETVKLVAGLVMSTEIPSAAGQCNFGNAGSEDLGKEILRACIDEEYRKEHHVNCPCSRKTA